MSTTTITTPEGFWAKLYERAVAIWHSIVQADAEINEVVQEHPEIVVAAAALEAEAPASVRLGINTAEELAGAVNGILLHSQDAGVTAVMVAAKLAIT